MSQKGQVASIQLKKKLPEVRKIQMISKENPIKVKLTTMLRVTLEEL